MPTASKKNPLKFEITEDYARVEYIENGVKTERVGDVTALLDVFKSMTTSYVSPILPMNCRRFIKNGNNVYVFMYYEEGIIKDFGYHNERVKIPFPKTIVMCHLTELGENKYRFVDSTFFPVKETYLNSDDIKLYFWPFPNQSTEFKGRTCWGNEPAIVSLRRNCELFNMSSIFHIYFQANANDDYGWRFRQVEHRMPDYIRDQEVFPYEKLNDTGQTMKSLMQLLLRPVI